MNNKEKVVALLKALETGEEEPLNIINPHKYIQHNLSAADGIEGLRAFLKVLPENSVKVDTVRVFEDGDYVFAHSQYEIFGPKAGFDIFRFEEGLIVEHWDNLQEITGPNPSGHTMLDGTTEAAEAGQTAANKELVKNLVQDVLMGNNPNKLSGYFDGDTYLQHNPMIGDGVSSLENAFKKLAEQGVAVRYDKIHQVLGEGNFVLTVSEGSYRDKATSFYDLFRVEQGRIAEHWDVIEDIMPEAERKNTNGKF